MYWEITCVVHVPSRAKDTSTTIRCGSTRMSTVITAKVSATTLARRERITRRVAELPADVYLRPLEPPKQRQSSHRADRQDRCLDVSQSKLAVDLGRDDLRRQDADPSAEHVRRRERAKCRHEDEQHRAGNGRISSGRVTRRSLCDELAPSPAAASSSVVSKRSSPAETNRKTYTYIV